MAAGRSLVWNRSLLQDEHGGGPTTVYSIIPRVAVKGMFSYTALPKTEFLGLPLANYTLERTQIVLLRVLFKTLGILPPRGRGLARRGCSPRRHGRRRGFLRPCAPAHACRLGELQLDFSHPRLGAVPVLPRVTPRAAVVGVRRVVARPRGAQRRRVGLGRVRFGLG